MRTSVIPKSRGLSEAAEREMRIWALDMEAHQRLEQERAAPKELIYPYITISRKCGVDAGQLAKSVASKFGWKALDRELLDYMAEHYHWSKVALDYVDEKTASWFHDTFGKMLDQQVVIQAEYVSCVGKLVLLGAQHESNVFLGRGPQFILPRERGLAVRIIAPRSEWVIQVMSRRECTRKNAEKLVDQTDNDRAAFIKRYFQREVADPRLYDLVINLEHTSRCGFQSDYRRLPDAPRADQILLCISPGG